jgi:hypothetical protein
MKIYSLVIALLITGKMAFTQTDTSALYRVLQRNDSLLFDAGFNNCDIAQFESLLSTDFEFYHDEGGRTETKQAFINDIRNNICGLSYRPVRRLVAGTLKVYPLKKKGVLYGAIQTGEHRFYALEKDKPEYLTSKAKFTLVWLLEQNDWKLTRALSYDHQVPE